ncbi:MAG: hypothetical protein LBV12_06390 [Puniceicoccales bacterium]|jgi:hypothetical protein|nr:hypothetical protein [Puniceicoccales bacterium]
MINLWFYDEATPSLERILQGVTHPRPILFRLGKMVEVALRAHFATREQDSPNKQGWPRQHFWAGIRRVTALAGATDEGATVTIAHPAIALKVKSGTVKAQEADNLAIPVHESVYGIRARECQIPGLFKWTNPKTEKEFLASSVSGHLILYYHLREFTIHDPDPRALPDMNELERRLCDRAAELVAEQKN